MKNKLKIIMVDSKYCDYLRQYDKKVPYNFKDKERRPFVGVLFTIDQSNYFAPLSSPKKKHLKMKNTIDFLKINGGKLGAINFNNMLPIVDCAIIDLDLNCKNISKKDKMYFELLQSQFYWLKRQENIIYKKSIGLYNKYIDNKLEQNIKDRCLNFKLLEQKSKLYIKK